MRLKIGNKYDTDIFEQQKSLSRPFANTYLNFIPTFGKDQFG